jgi:flagellar motor switch protein FliM
MGRAKSTFSRLLDLKVGDLLLLDGSESSPLPIYVQGRRKMTGVPRVVGGNLAVVVERALRGQRRGTGPVETLGEGAYPAEKNP